MSVARAFVVCIFLTSVAVSGFAEGASESEEVSRELHISRFTSVDTSHGIDVEIHQSDEFRVILYADRWLADRVEVRKVRDELRIRLEPDFPSFRAPSVGGRARVQIDMPDLSRVRASGGATVTLDMNLREAKIAVDLSGGSRMEGSLLCDTLSMGGSAGSGCDLEGAADWVVLNGSGGAQFDLSDFSAIDADVRLSGGSSVLLAVEDNLAVSASGGSHVTVRGTPTVERQVLSGGSWIRSE